MKKLEKNKTDSRIHGGKLSEPPRKPVTVLHVDDDPNDTTLLRVACAKADVNFELQNIGDCTEAMDYLSGTGKYADRAQYQFPGLVLLDLKMPRATGYDVLEWLKTKSFPSLTVAVLSGSVLESDKEKCQQLGAHAYFTKCASISQIKVILQKVENMLDHSLHAQAA